MVGVLHLLTLKIQKTLNKSFAKLYQASVALLGSQNRESIGNSLIIHCILVKNKEQVWVGTFLFRRWYLVGNFYCKKISILGSLLDAENAKCSLFY